MKEIIINKIVELDQEILLNPNDANLYINLLSITQTDFSFLTSLSTALSPPCSQLKIMHKNTTFFNKNLSGKK